MDRNPKGDNDGLSGGAVALVAAALLVKGRRRRQGHELF